MNLELSKTFSHQSRSTADVDIRRAIGVDDPFGFHVIHCQRLMCQVSAQPRERFGGNSMCSF